jgi:hypothetical protein
MPNVVLDRMVAERNELTDTIESVLNQVQDRDLTDAEQAVLNHTRERIIELDNQIRPLEDYERVKAAHQQTVQDLPRPEPRAIGGAPDRSAGARRADGLDAVPTYRSAGAFVVDYLRAVGIMQRGQSDPEAAARVQQTRAMVNQTTTDTPGILPTPIVGSVVNLIDANRPLITSLGGAKAMAGIPGTTFTRPKITQHTTVGLQSAEKTVLPSQKMVINSVQFTKATYGGVVDISRQDIDWTSPAAWDILIRDLANVYAIQTETVVATAFKTAAAGTAVAVGTDDLKGWTLALYTAAMRSYQASYLMPDRIWCSLDVWAALGSLVDVARVVFPSSDADIGSTPPLDSYDIGSSALSTFRGDVLGLPRIVVPTFPAGTCIVGPSVLFEAYEEVIGLLSVIEPSVLGVTVAYGGYIAFGSLAGPAFVPLTTPAGLPTMEEQLPIDAATADSNDRTSGGVANQTTGDTTP